MDFFLDIISHKCESCGERIMPHHAFFKKKCYYCQKIVCYHCSYKKEMRDSKICRYLALCQLHGGPNHIEYENKGDKRPRKVTGLPKSSPISIPICSMSTGSMYKSEDDTEGKKIRHIRSI